MTRPSVKFICSENARNNGLYNLGLSVIREEYQLLPCAIFSSLQIVFPLSIICTDTSSYMMGCLHVLVLFKGEKVFIPLSLVHPVLQFMQEIQLRRCANIQPNVLVSRLKMLPPPGPLRTPSYQAPLIGLRFLTSSKYRCH